MAKCAKGCTPRRKRKKGHKCPPGKHLKKKGKGKGTKCVVTR